MHAFIRQLKSRYREIANDCLYANDSVKHTIKKSKPDDT